MARVTGFGGIFFKTPDPEATARWFTEKLDAPMETWGRMFPWLDPSSPPTTILGLHRHDSTYFGPSPLPFMINLRVDDLDAMLARVRERGVEVIHVFEPDPHGRFAHIAGPDGLTIELWQPVDDASAAP
jgi:predicted enzyme related to lactoylglutathione lyase